MRKTARTRHVTVFVDAAWQSLRARLHCDTKNAAACAVPEYRWRGSPWHNIG